MSDGTDPNILIVSTPVKRRRRWLFVVLGLPALLLIALGLFWRSCSQFAASAEAGPVLPAVATGEVIVVLTGDALRIPRALELLRARGSDYILFSGVEPGVSLTDIINQQGSSATNIHTVWSKILTESRSRTTLENARIAQEILAGKGAKRIVLVTSDYHMPRASRVFEREMRGTEIVLYPVTSDFAGGTMMGWKKFFVESWKWLLYQLGILRWVQEWQLSRAVPT